MGTVIEGVQLQKYPLVNPLHSGNPQMSTFANSEDPDEMQYTATFHQGLHCLIR